MVDPLTEVVTLLQPSARFSKTVVAAGPWYVRQSNSSPPFYCVVLEGGCRITVDGGQPIELQPGDFVLAPAAVGVATSSLEPAPTDAESPHRALDNGEFRIGRQDGPTDMRIQIGHCHFGSPDAALLVSLLPRLVHIRGDHRLAMLVKLVGEESRAHKPAREVILSRLLEVLLIEALRSTVETTSASPGLVRGLADDRLALAIRAMHADPARAWTVAELAKEAALSRSAFFERFNRTVGIAPMSYLLTWRMALAKQLLRQDQSTIASVAESVGYRSASTFSVAFTRHVGQPPGQYARAYDDKLAQQA